MTVLVDDNLNDESLNVVNKLDEELESIEDIDLQPEIEVLEKEEKDMNGLLLLLLGLIIAYMIWNYFNNKE